MSGENTSFVLRKKNADDDSQNKLVLIKTMLDKWVWKQVNIVKASHTPVSMVGTKEALKFLRKLWRKFAENHKTTDSHNQLYQIWL